MYVPFQINILYVLYKLIYFCVLCHIYNNYSIDLLTWNFYTDNPVDSNSHRL